MKKIKELKAKRENITAGLVVEQILKLHGIYIKEFLEFIDLSPKEWKEYKETNNIDILGTYRRDLIRELLKGMDLHIFLTGIEQYEVQPESYYKERHQKLKTFINKYLYCNSIDALGKATGHPAFCITAGYKTHHVIFNELKEHQSDKDTTKLFNEYVEIVK